MCTIIYFFSGTAILLYFDWFCKHVKWIFPCCILHFCLTLFYDYAFLYYIEPLVFSAIIVAVAYYCKPLNFLQRYDNISYGLYLYHFPVIQVLIHYNIADYSLTLCFIITLIITSILATISWLYIEKPLMNKCA